MDDRTGTIEREIGRMTATLESAGLWVTGEREGGVVTLIGEVDSERNRQAALDIARATIGRAGARIVDAIEIAESVPGEAYDEQLIAASPDEATDAAGTIPGGGTAGGAAGILADPDFT
ncbi:MAG: BON domain-containing protein [Chloroflexota bacterium]